MPKVNSEANQRFKEAADRLNCKARALAETAGVSVPMIYAYLSAGKIPGVDVANALSAHLRRINAQVPPRIRPYKAAQLTTDALWPRGRSAE